MDATHTPDPDAFPAPHVPLAVDGGLSYNDIGRNPDAYVLVQVGPWDGFQDGDTVQIRWSVAGTVVGTRAASRADQGKRLDIFVHASDIRALGDGTHEVTARVTHAAGAAVDSSPAHIRVKTTVPGGHDTNLQTPYINERLPVPKVSPAVITPETTAISVTIPAYTDMAAEDLILVRWNVAGNDVSHGPIEIGEVGVPVVVPIHEPTLRAGGAGVALNVSYQVFDRVHNWSLWSPRAQVKVEAPGAPTDPWVEGTVKNEGETLDVDALENADVKVTVRAGQVGATDTVTVHWAGTTAAGLPLAFDTEPQIPQVGQPTLTFVVPYRWVEPLAQGTARAWYTAVPADRSAERSSLQHNLTVTGTVAQLIQPSVAEAKDTMLDPADIVGGVAHALVPAWHGMQIGDSVELIGDGTSSGGSPSQWTDRQDVSSKMLNDDVAFDVPRDVVASLLGGRLRFHYVVTPYEALTIQGVVRRFALAALVSDPLELEVRDASTVPALPAPTIPELEPGGYLDPDKHTTAHVDVPAYTGIAKGDQIDFTLQGGVTPYEDQMRVTSPTTPPRFTLGGQVIQGNRGLLLDASYTVSRDEAMTGTSFPLSFRIGALSAELPLPTVDKANNGQLNPIDATADIVISVPPNAGIGKTDNVTLTVAGLPANTPPIPAIPGDPAGTAFRLPPSFFAGALGKEVSIHYSVVPATGGASRTSPALTLFILDFTANDARVHKPTIDEANGLVLDMNTLTGSATVAVQAWPLMVAGQRFRLSARSGSTSLTITENESVATPGSFKKTLDRSWLTRLADNSSLTLELTIAFDGEMEGNARLFSSDSYTVRAEHLVLAAPSIPESSGGELVGWLKSATLRVPANPGLRDGDSVKGVFNGSDLGPLPAAGSGTIDFTLSAALLTAAQGHAVNAHYSVQRNGTSLTSPTLTVTVLAPPQFSAPVIPESSSGQLPGWLPATLRIPSNAGQKAGDFVMGYFNGVNLDSKPVEGPGEIDLSISSALTYVAKGQTVSSYFTIQRSGSTWSSATLSVQVIAGIEFPEPSIPQARNGELDGQLSAALLSIPESAELKSGDVVTGIFNDTVLTIAFPKGPGQIDMEVSSKVIEAARGRIVECYYSVVRQSEVWKSSHLTVSVTGLDPPISFPAPSIPEMSEGRLSGSLKSATLRVPASAGTKAGDSVAAYFNSERIGLSELRDSNGKDFPISSDAIVSARSKTVDAYYRVYRIGMADSQSKLLELRVDAGDLHFPAPVIPEMSDGGLSGSLTSATLRIPSSAGTKAGDAVAGYFNGRFLGQSELTDSNGKDFPIYSHDIVNARSKTVDAYYAVFRRGLPDAPSDVLKVTVGAGDPYFPPPVIPQMSGGRLDGHLQSATISIAVGGDMEYGDMVYVRFDETFYTGRMAQGKVLDFYVDRATIERARNRRIFCGYSVKRDSDSWDSEGLVVDVTG